MNDANELEKFVKLFLKEETVKTIVAAAAKVEGAVYLRFPKDPAKQTNLHLFVQVDKILGFNDTSFVGTTIKKTLGFNHANDDEDAEIKIIFSNPVGEEATAEKYSDAVLLTIRNFSDGIIQKFLASHYPQYVSPLQSGSSGGKIATREILIFVFTCRRTQFFGFFNNFL